jgi:hypothetical protein
MVQIIAKVLQIPGPLLKRLALLIDVPVYIVGGLDSFAGVVKNTLADICLDAELGEPGAPRAAQVMCGEGGDAMLLEPLEASGDASGDVLRVSRRSLVCVREHVPGSAEGVQIFV